MRHLYLSVYCLVTAGLLGCTQADSPNAPEAEQEGDAAASGQEKMAEDPVTAEDVREELDEAAQAVEQFSERRTNEVVQSARTNLDELKKKIEQLEGDVGALRETARTQFEESMQDLKSKLDDAEQRFTRLQDAGTEAWAAGRDDLREAIDDLESAYEEAAAALRQGAGEDEAEGEGGPAAGAGAEAAGGADSPEPPPVEPPPVAPNSP
jgi:TolA-binding protein